MGKVNTVQLRPGDEFVFSRRRFEEVQDDQTMEKSIVHHDVLIASVRCPEDIEITGGEVVPEFSDEQKFLVIRLRCRNLNPT